MSEPAPSAGRPPPSARSGYRAFLPLATRWADNDAYGHMNNVVHYALFDTAVNSWLIRAGLLDLERGATAFLVVETGCRYFSELAFPDPVTAGLRLGRLGASSIRYEIGLFRGEDGIAAAEGHFIHVQVDRATRRPLELDAASRAKLAELQA